MEEKETADPSTPRGPVEKNISRMSPLNCRSLHSATPDFLLDLVALSQFMRPSLRKGAYADLSSAPWQEIRVRFGRDDKGGKQRFHSEPLLSRRGLNFSRTAQEYMVKVEPLGKESRGENRVAGYFRKA